MKITIDTDRIGALVQDGKNIALSADAENALLELLELRETLDKAYDEAKAEIEKNALEYNPNFSSVQGSQIKVGYRRFGSKYSIDEANFDQLPSDMYKKTIQYRPETKAVDAYLEEKGSLPLGILETNRDKQITIKKLEDFDNAA